MWCVCVCFELVGERAGAKRIIEFKYALCPMHVSSCVCVRLIIDLMVMTTYGGWRLGVQIINRLFTLCTLTGLGADCRSD